MLNLPEAMSDFPKPEVILTHESDLDGLTSGVLLQRLATKLFGETPRLEAWNYNGWKQRAMTEGAAWVCDLSFEPRLDRPNWMIVDHHVTDAVPKNAKLIHDTTRSAGSLCYELCRQHDLANAELDRLMELNNVADMFLPESPVFDEAGDYANLVKTYGFWNLHQLIEGELERLLDHPLLTVIRNKREIEDPLGFEWSCRHVVEITPEVGWVETVVGNTNLIVHRLLDEKVTRHSALLTLFRRAPGVVMASIRSKNGEALKIAEKLNGGGHANAAGATLPRSVKQIPDAVEYLRNLLSAKAAPPARKPSGFNSMDDLLGALE